MRPRVVTAGAGHDHLEWAGQRSALAHKGRRRLGELLNSAVIKAVDATATAPDRSGWVTAVIPIESLEHAQAELLRLGAEAEIITPAALRSRMTAVAGVTRGVVPLGLTARPVQAFITLAAATAGRAKPRFPQADRPTCLTR